MNSLRVDIYLNLGKMDSIMDADPSTGTKDNGLKLILDSYSNLRIR